MKALIVAIALLSMVCFVFVGVMAQNQEDVICPTCKHVNKSQNNFCTACGTRLIKETLAQKSDSARFYRTPSRLFSVPSGIVLPSLEMNLVLGSSFGLQEKQSFLGNVSFGLGDVAEFEISTAGLLGSLAMGTTNISTVGAKAEIFSEASVVPSVALFINSSNDWENVRNDANALSAAATSAYKEGLRGLDYQTRLTSAGIALSKHVQENVIATVGFSLSDIRHKDVHYVIYSLSSSSSADTERNSQINVMAGIVVQLNAQTSFMVEAQSIPLFNFNITQQKIQIDRMYLGVAGIRFALGKAFSLDSGLRYQSNFIGLADVQMRIALNVIVSFK